MSAGKAAAGISSREIERASLRAWPALERREKEGWVTRWARGYTKRANSVTVLDATTQNAGERIDDTERYYAERGLPAIFRLVSFAAPVALDGELASRGYAVLHPTDVLCLDLQSNAPTARPGDPEIKSLDDWMAAYCWLAERPPEQHDVHRDLLSRIEGQGRGIVALPACAHDGEHAVSCALGVLDGPLFGLFDVVTAPAERRKGHATRLLRATLGWAEVHGATLAYLQVMQANPGARRLYERLGFRPAYHYWYRVQSR